MPQAVRNPRLTKEGEKTKPCEGRQTARLAALTKLERGKTPCSKGCVTFCLTTLRERKLEENGPPEKNEKQLVIPHRTEVDFRVFLYHGEGRSRRDGGGGRKRKNQDALSESQKRHETPGKKKIGITYMRRVGRGQRD